VAHFGRRASAFFGRMSVFMSALSIGDAACFGRVSAFFGRASVLPALGRAFVFGHCALPVGSGFVGLAAIEVLVAVGRVAVVGAPALFTPALGPALVLVLDARPVAFVGPAAVEVLRIVAGHIAIGVVVGALLQVAKAAARPSVDQRLVEVCVAAGLLWLTVCLLCGC